jgi:Flp pilus assembly protein TadD
MTPRQEDELRDGAHWSAVEEAVELLQEERFHEAMVELRRVLLLGAANPYAFYFLGVGFFEIGELEPARDAYVACLKIAPGHLGARVALSHVLRILGDVRGAVREGMAALSRAPGDPDALHAIGLAHHAYGDDVAAKKYLEAFLAAGPEFEVAVEVRALLASLPSDDAPAPDQDED